MRASRSRLNFRKIFDCLRVGLNPSRKHLSGLRTLHKQNAHVRLHSPAKPILHLNRTIGESDHHSPARALRTAELSGFLTLIQSRDVPDR
jgi:hypothetical protein